MEQLLDTLTQLVSGPGTAADLFFYFKGGGIVMYPLLLCSAVMWALIFERVVAFHRLEFRDCGMGELLAWCRQREKRKSGTGLRRQIGAYLQENRTPSTTLNRCLLDECHLKLLPSIDRNIAAITILAMVAPLLGLLGTVTGMMTAFDVITLFGTGNARALAGGISEALITTQSGLLVSIPGVFASAVLTLRSRRLREKLEESIMMLKRHA